MSDRPKPMVVIVRDGWGRNPNPEHDAFNAVKRANTPRCDALLEHYPWTLIHTSGEDVGLPEGTMGNSEVGHQNIGAGRIVDQESVRITKAIRTGAFFENEALVRTVKKARETDRFVHLLGIASDAGVHGLMSHLYACLELCKQQEQTRVALHLFTDGRDTGPFTGREFVRQIEAKCEEIGVGQIASICGRYYAMDRDNRWERVHQAYSCLTGIHARKLELPWAQTAQQAIERYYNNPTNDSQKGDEFITPTMIGESLDDALAGRISDGDAIIFYNYRGDRPREITRAFVLPDDKWAEVAPSPDSGEQGFNRVRRIDVDYVTLTAYDQTLNPYVKVAYPKPPKMRNTAGEFLASKGMTQLRVAETEKFPHVTFFFNDYREDPYEGETQEKVQSPKVATYDLQPEMSAAGITQVALDAIHGDDCPDFILMNYANGDMVGHTGVLDAAIKAVETVDECVGRIIDATLKKGGNLIVTADHGNSEQMHDPDTGSPHTAHTTYDVEAILVAPQHENMASGAPDTPAAGLNDDGRLADVLPTALKLMNLPQPDEMTGRSLL